RIVCATLCGRGRRLKSTHCDRWCRTDQGFHIGGHRMPVLANRQLDSLASVGAEETGLVGRQHVPPATYQPTAEGAVFRVRGRVGKYRIEAAKIGGTRENGDLLLAGVLAGEAPGGHCSVVRRGNRDRKAGLEFGFAEEFFAGLDGKIRIARHPYTMIPQYLALLIAEHELLKGDTGHHAPKGGGVRQ